MRSIKVLLQLLHSDTRYMPYSDINGAIVTLNKVYLITNVEKYLLDSYIKLHYTKQYKTIAAKRNWIAKHISLLENKKGLKNWNTKISTIVNTIQALNAMLEKINFELYFKIGLCRYINTLHFYNIITVRQKNLVKQLLYKDYANVHSYSWPMAKAEPRINWLNEKLASHNTQLTELLKLNK